MENFVGVDLPDFTLGVVDHVRIGGRFWRSAFQEGFLFVQVQVVEF